MTPIRFVALFIALVSLCYAHLLPRQDSAEYIISAKQGTTKADADSFENALRALVGEAEINSISDEDGVPVMWRTQLKPDQLDKVKAYRAISSVAPNKRIPLDSIPDAEDTDPDAEPELGPAPFEAATVAKRASYEQTPTWRNKLYDLRVLSTPPGTKRTSPNFYYEDPAGEGITIYHIDGGLVNLAHDEFTAASGATRRIIDLDESKENTAFESKHATCSASKIVGRTTGTAKRSNLVLIRTELTNWGLFASLRAAAADISKNKLQGKAVVSMSISLQVWRWDEFNEVRDQIKEISNLDVPVVCAAGNSGKKGKVVTVDSLPALVSDMVPLIVVGSASRSLKKSWFSQQGNRVTTWAVGERVKCADYKKATRLRTDSGTSFTAPQVAGIAAYLMSHPVHKRRFRKGTVAEDMRDVIRDSSFQRVQGNDKYPPIAWNLWNHEEAQTK
ncbi:alkaline serine protease [Colletotrichum tabaci]|uniref:Alkaline serine protease n=1 Tax=Colletotrichum tabaci TaxID=1209068 RepID=A0AAV9TVA7_9PEZI